MTLAANAGNPKVIYQDLLIDETDQQLIINGTATVYGKAFLPPKNSSFGIFLKFGTVTNPCDVKVELEVGILPPTTEGSADSNWAVGDTISEGITDEVMHALVASPVAAPYCRLKLTGQGLNAADTILNYAKFTFAKNQ